MAVGLERLKRMVRGRQLGGLDRNLPVSILLAVATQGEQSTEVPTVSQQDSGPRYSPFRAHAVL